jgi:hypothetical protein
VLAAIGDPAVTAAPICDVLRSWIQLLADRSQPSEILDQALADALAALSQRTCPSTTTL